MSQAFIAFARAHGVEIDPGKLDDSGKLRRCGTTDHPRSKNGAYVWDGRGGFVWAWDGEGRAVSFSDPHARPLSPEEQARRDSRRKAVRDEQAVLHRKAAEWAARLLSIAKPKTDTEKGAADEIVTALVAKLRGAPVIEGQKLEGREFRLQHASHTMRINEFRHGVNIGARIEQSRVGYNLRKQGREKLTDYIKELYEEVICMAISGARGIGGEIQHFDTTYTGYPNALRAPDAAHLYVGKAGDKAKATLVQADTLALTTINKLRTKAKKMLGGQPDKAVKMTPISMGSKKVFCLATPPECIQDIRDDAGAQGWFEAQKALTTAIGKESEIFKGGAGMFNGVLVDEMETCVKFGDYGAGANLPAARSLFMGANAGFIAHGTKGMADGMSVALDEDTADRKHDSILFFEMIFGADKTAFNGMDYGLITVDSAFTAAV